MAAEKTTPLKGELDRFSGIIVDEGGLPEEAGAFESALTESLAIWKEAGRRGCWLKIPHRLAGHAVLALKHGFTYHHTQKDYCMLTTWLSSDTNKIPAYASHYIGVGGVVVNDKNEILTVTEKYLVHTYPGFYKLPGGAVDPGEDIPAAVEREVWEETGIKAVFQEVICFRQQTNFHFGLTDMYFVCRLKPLTFDINKDDGEIDDCKWLDFDEFMRIQAKFPLLQEVSEIIKDNVFNNRRGMVSKSVANGFRPDPGTLFYIPRL